MHATDGTNITNKLIIGMQNLTSEERSNFFLPCILNKDNYIALFACEFMLKLQLSLVKFYFGKFSLQLSRFPYEEGGPAVLQTVMSVI